MNPSIETLTRYGVPEHLHDGLLLYVHEHIPMGHCLTAIVSNDLREAFARADEETAAAMRQIVRWLYNEAPSNCWGSPERVRAWLTRGEK